MLPSTHCSGADSAIVQLNMSANRIFTCSSLTIHSGHLIGLSHSTCLSHPFSSSVDINQFGAFPIDLLCLSDCAYRLWTKQNSNPVSSVIIRNTRHWYGTHSHAHTNCGHLIGHCQHHQHLAYWPIGHRVSVNAIMYPLHLLLFTDLIFAHLPCLWWPASSIWGYF